MNSIVLLDLVFQFTGKIGIFRTIKGMVTLGSLMSRLVSKKAEAKTPVQDVLYNQFKRVTLNTPLGKVSRILERDHFVLVVHNQRICKPCFLKKKSLLNF